MSAGAMLPVLPALLLALAPPSPPTTEPSTRPAADGPVVVVETTMGTIKIGLFSSLAPISVANFLEYVRAGHYDGTIFHRVIPGFMAQGGGFDEQLEEKPTRPPIPNEARNRLRNSRGTVAMARLTDPNSATAQFFINVKSNHTLDFGIGGAGYAVFGEVLEGMDVVDEIVSVPSTRRGPHENLPRNPIVIRAVRELAAAPQPAAPRPNAAPTAAAQRP